MSQLFVIFFEFDKLCFQMVKNVTKFPQGRTTTSANYDGMTHIKRHVGILPAIQTRSPAFFKIHLVSIRLHSPVFISLSALICIAFASRFYTPTTLPIGSWHAT